jgi:hypothetical protein
MVLTRNLNPRLPQGFSTRGSVKDDEILIDLFDPNQNNFHTVHIRSIFRDKIYLPIDTILNIIHQYQDQHGNVYPPNDESSSASTPQTLYDARDLTPSPPSSTNLPTGVEPPFAPTHIRDTYVSCAELEIWKAPNQNLPPVIIALPPNQSLPPISTNLTGWTKAINPDDLVNPMLLREANYVVHAISTDEIEKLITVPFKPSTIPSPESTSSTQTPPAQVSAVRTILRDITVNFPCGWHIQLVDIPFPEECPDPDNDPKAFLGLYDYTGKLRRRINYYEPTTIEQIKVHHVQELVDNAITHNPYLAPQPWYPFDSKEKAYSLSSDWNTVRYLYSKINPLINPHHSQGRELYLRLLTATTLEIALFRSDNGELHTFKVQKFQECNPQSIINAVTACIPKLPYPGERTLQNITPEHLASIKDTKNYFQDVRKAPPTYLHNDKNSSNQPLKIIDPTPLDREKLSASPTTSPESPSETQNSITPSTQIQPHVPNKPFDILEIIRLNLPQGYGLILQSDGSLGDKIRLIDSNGYPLDQITHYKATDNETYIDCILKLLDMAIAKNLPNAYRPEENHLSKIYARGTPPRPNTIQAHGVSCNNPTPVQVTGTVVGGATSAAKGINHPKHMTQAEFQLLAEGDVVRPLRHPKEVFITEVFGKVKTGVQTYSISNYLDWELIRKANYDKPNP